ncbi:MAG: hypothetical protein M1829_003214 [Trizodia sp. TS-e1964]|nr:MAG: hypothetical protein M1829_003214 [Trizodia sp. TS-e1964]
MPAASGSAQATHSLKPQRPAFSTLQQHFTPRKPSAHNRKTSGSLHSLVYSTANNPVSSENAHLQTELLHLHILHRSVAPVLQQWYNSAEEQIRRRFELISNKSSKLRIIEQRDQEQKNLRAVREWALNKRELGLAEKVQLLGLLIQEINTTSSTGGKFIRVLREFERWVANVEETWHVRSLKIPDKAELDIIASLDSTWRSEIAGLMRRAEQNLKDIAVLGPALEESGIATLLDRCKLAAESMVAELKRMEQVENIVMQRERVFLKELIQVVMSNKKPVEVKAAPHQSGVWNSAAIPQ